MIKTSKALCLSLNQGNLFTITSRMNCGISLTGHKN